MRDIESLQDTAVTAAALRREALARQRRAKDQAYQGPCVFQPANSEGEVWCTTHSNYQAPGERECFSNPARARREAEAELRQARKGTDLLRSCQRCRNAMAYLLDGTSADDAQLVRYLTSRLRSLPDRHATSHLSGDSDTQPPHTVEPE